MALRWEEPERILKRFASGQDFNEHANTLLAKMVGAARLAELSDSELHRKACVNFWENVRGSGAKTYATGGTSVHEGMPEMRRLANTALRMPQETCVSYNLIKVTRSLYRITGETKSIEYYERSLWNAILGSQDPQSGYKTYYQPQGSNSIKDFRSNEMGCYCCNGTGLENPSRSAEMIYSTRGQQLRVQLFVPSKLTLPDWGITLVHETNFPSQAKGRLVLECQQSKTFTISVRVPSWVNSDASLKVNGQAVDGSYGGPDDWYVKWFPNGLSPQWIIVDLVKIESISKVQWIAAREDLEDKIA